MVRFVSFEYFKDMMPYESEGSTERHSLGLLFAGMLAGVSEAVLVVTPSEMIKVRMQDDARGGSKVKYTSVTNTVRTVVREEGITALYKGVTATCFRQASSSGIRFMMYGKLLQMFRKRDSIDGGHTVKNRPWHSFAAGGIAGFVTAGEM